MSVSSINFSRTSFTRNREAGAVVAGAGAQPLIDMMLATYEADWSQAKALVPNPAAWSSANLTTIRDPADVPVVLPKPSSTQAAYYNPPSPAPIAVTGQDVSVTASTSPDFSSRTLLEA